MSVPTPLQSFLGGIGLSLPVFALVKLNGSVFGISGFLHRAVRGGREALMAVAGLVLGGIVIGLVEGEGPQTLSTSLAKLAFSGFLVGMGTRLGNGCTSGHMICGLSRFSLRSLAATATFFSTAVITTYLVHPGELPPVAPMDWTLGPIGKVLLALQLIPLAIETGLYVFAPEPQPEPHANDKATEETDPNTTSTLPLTSLRLLASAATSLNFALALRLSNLTEPSRVIAFLALPFHQGFDPSLAFLAMGALPTSIILYQYCRGSELPRLGGPWSIPGCGLVDTRLILGAATFGIGWGLEGICPGPGLVNIGRAVVTGSHIPQLALWVSAVVAGGLVV
ncbi:hypothetical protein JAAARDRAFT_45703 [Jaapia argillacea MUCL 33604]|uniref:Uncharacterized protein n=1 Tax=Jaapia argillacea MUCL 33604 TaxID=933084 RepID=A0A067Q1T4_9AGAM|nr:hypothetical protein JAAARDRAFT_45703 [Jaapia argillacea MUCL 33604]